MGKQHKVNIPMCAALILLCLTMISIHLTSGLYARYTVTASGHDSARVAKFAVGGSSEENPLSIENIPDDDSDIYTFTVTNDSEVTVEYTLEFVFASEVSAWVELTLDKTATEPGTAGTFTNGTNCSFSPVFTLAPGGSRTHNVLMGADWTDLTKTANAETVQRNLTFTVNVHAQQID